MHLSPATASPFAAVPFVAPAPVGSATAASCRVLVVDDEETIRLALAKFLRLRGYDVRTASSGAEALHELAAARAADRPMAAMLCDVRMPGFSGVELVPRALEVEGDLAILMLTAVNDAATATEALTRGAVDYLMKPVELGDLQLAVQRGLERRAREVERRAMEQRIRAEVALRTEELEREQAALRCLTVSIVETLVTAQEAKDVHLRGHSQRVSDLGVAVAEELGLDARTIDDIRLAGRLHDVGKIGVREEVLNKPGRLTADEFEHVKAHVRIGVDILAPLRDIIGTALQYVHDHHEQVGGGGYPRGLAGEAISIGGRILCACDVFDALTSTRPYREPLSPEAALDFLGSQAGQMVDPAVYAALRAVVCRERIVTEAA